MIVPTRRKMAVARAAFRAVMGFRRLAGRGRLVEVRRGGIRWALDLGEAIDLVIYLLGAFEPSTRNAFRRLVPRGGVAVDVGANIGAHTFAMARWVGEDGTVVAAEPTQPAFRRLIRNIELNPGLARPIRARQVMLVARDDTTPASTLYASWPLTADPRAHRFHMGVALPTEGAVGRRLDDLVSDERLQRVDLIKIDVDGYEADVLEGAGRTLARHKPAVVFEFAPYALEERGRSAEELLSMLRDHGYDIHDIAGRRIRSSDRDIIAGMPRGAGVNLIAEARGSAASVGPGQGEPNRPGR